MKRSLPVLFLAALFPLPARAQADKAELATRAQSLLRQYCHRCHGQEFAVEGLDVLNLKSLTARMEDTDPYVIPGKSGKSSLYRRFGTSMPPRKVRERPSPADREIIKQWIDAGATPFPVNKARVVVAQGEVLGAIRDALHKAEKEDRPYLRFFTLTHLHNDPRVSEADLLLYQAALAKAVKGAELLRGSPTVGTVTACFHLAWTGKVPPRFDPPPRGANAPHSGRSESVRARRQRLEK